MSGAVEPMLPGVEWPTPVLTVNLAIKRELERALHSDAANDFYRHAAFEFEAGDTSDKATIAKLRWQLHLYAFICAASNADLLIQLEKHAPRQADEVAQSWDFTGEAGEWGELIWEWAADRGLDPDALYETAKQEVPKRAANGT